MTPAAAIARTIASTSFCVAPANPSNAARAYVQAKTALTLAEATSSEFAKTLVKGAHIQVEGELRSREYTSKKTESKQRIWEVRVASILKLDRAEKAAAEDQEHDELSQEQAVA